MTNKEVILHESDVMQLAGDSTELEEQVTALVERGMQIWMSYAGFVLSYDRLYSKYREAFSLAREALAMHKEGLTELDEAKETARTDLLKMQKLERQLKENQFEDKTLNCPKCGERSLCEIDNHRRNQDANSEA